MAPFVCHSATGACASALCRPDVQHPPFGPPRAYLPADPVASNPYTDDRLHRPLEWPLRIVAVILSFISGTVIYSETHLPEPKWLLVLSAILFGFWFGYLGIVGRRPEIRKFPRR